MRSVVITGLGLVSSLGNSVQATWEALLASQRGTRPLTRYRLDLEAVPLVGQVSDHIFNIHPCATAALAMAAGREAMAQAGLTPHQCSKTVCILGTSVGGMAASEEAYRSYRQQQVPLPNSILRQHPASFAAEALAQDLGLGGLVTAVTTACSSGAGAILMAQQLIRSGQCDIVIAGGADPLCRLTIDGFTALKVVDPNWARPFDQRREGLNLGEGAGILVLESEAHALARGAKPLATLLGASNTCDAYHGTAPHPEGRGVISAFWTCLKQAGCSPSAIQYINAHGTGTQQNDSTEGQAIVEVFGSQVPVSSIKGALGHTLGASGGIEAVICVQALLHHMAPPSVGCEQKELPALNVIVQPTPLPQGSVVLSNSFAFGGNNTCLLFGEARF